MTGNGEPFVSCELTNFDLGDEVYAGLYVCSHTGDVVEKAVFRDVRVIQPVKQGFVPYRDFIGSQLEILDVPSGKLEVIYRSAQPFESIGGHKFGLPAKLAKANRLWHRESVRADLQ